MFTGEAIIALIALTAMEIVLGIDNIVFITIVTSRLPVEQRPLGRRLGLALALVFRIALLFTLNYITKKLTNPFFHLESIGITQELLRIEDSHFWESVNGVSWRDVILLAGGLFLVAKSVHEIHAELEPAGEGPSEAGKSVSFVSVLIQIGILDMVFSLDSVITAVGMADDLRVMVAAVVISVAVMIIFANPIGHFVEHHPTLKMLALSFLILIGVMLIAEGLGTHLNKNYIYFAMAFALGVEFLNMKLRRKHNLKV